MAIPIAIPKNRVKNAAKMALCTRIASVLIIHNCYIEYNIFEKEDLPNGETRMNVTMYKIYAQVLIDRWLFPLTNSSPIQNVITNL